MAMYIMRLYNSDVGKAAAVSVVLFVITLIVSLILFATMGDSEDRRMKRAAAAAQKGRWKIMSKAKDSYSQKSAASENFSYGDLHVSSV